MQIARMLREHTGVISLNLRGIQPWIVVLAEPSELTRLQNLTLGTFQHPGGPLDDLDLARLARCSQLQSGMLWPSASLTHLKLQDCHLRPALTIPSLQELCLVHCNITGLVALSSCSQLTKVTMQGLSRDEAQLPRLLRGLTQLQWLSLAGDTISADETMDRIRNSVPQLRYLSLAGCRKFAGTSGAQFSQLIELDLSNGGNHRHIGGEGASHRFVSRQTTLQVLKMEQTPASSIKLSLSRLRVMCVSGSNLHTLEMRKCRLCVGLARSLTESSHDLRKLVLQQCIKQDRVRLVLPQLDHLEVTLCNDLTALCLECAQLVTCSISECSSLWQLLLKGDKMPRLDLGPCPSLHWVALDSESIQELDLRGCADLHDLQLRCPNMRRLDASFCTRLTGPAMAAALAGAGRLQEVVLSACLGVDAVTVLALSMMQDLCSLDLSYTGIEDISLVLTTCALLVRLNLASCKRLRDASLQSLAVPTAGGSLKGADIAATMRHQQVLEAQAAEFLQWSADSQSCHRAWQAEDWDPEEADAPKDAPAAQSGQRSGLPLYAGTPQPPEGVNPPVPFAGRYPFGGLGLMGSGGLGSGPGLGTDTATSALNMAGSPCLYYSPAAAASGLLRPDLAVQAAPGASWLGLDLANRAAGAASARRPAGAVAPAHLPGKLEAVQTLRTHHQADDAARAAASMFPAPLVLPETDAGTVEDMQDIHAAPPLVPQDRQIVAEQSHEDPGPRGGCLTACCRLLSGRKRPAGQSLTARASKMSGMPDTAYTPAPLQAGQASYISSSGLLTPYSSAAADARSAVTEIECRNAQTDLEVQEAIGTEAQPTSDDMRQMTTLRNRQLQRVQQEMELVVRLEQLQGVCSTTTHLREPAGLLEALDVSYCALSPGILKALLQRPTLQTLALNGCTGVTEGFWDTLHPEQAASSSSSTAPKVQQLGLRDLSLVSCSQLRSCCIGLMPAPVWAAEEAPPGEPTSFVEVETSVKQLQQLKLNLSQVHTVALNLPNLTALDVSGCPRLTCLELRCPRLLAVKAAMCRLLEQERLIQGLLGCPSLKELLTSLAPNALAHLLEALPHLTVMDVSWQS
eukprot:jgi/Astpho2/4944/Aster-x0656